MARILGIDEAGRGPVIGPLVIAGVTIDDRKRWQLKKLGVKDSKKHTPKRREELFEKIITIVDDYDIRIISPRQVDAALNDPDNNLYCAKIINLLKPKRTFVDCPSTNIRAFKRYLRDRLETKTELIAEHKADEKYPIVSAASILAKVTRDSEIEKLRKRYGDFGSGYPSDPKTKDFILQKHSLPIYRKTWDTWKQVDEAKKQRRLGDF
jgi:ribonuclease HII